MATATTQSVRTQAAMADRLRSVQLLDARQVAALLSISLATLWRYVRAERVPQPIRLAPRCLRWRLRDLERFVGADGTERDGAGSNRTNT